MRTHRARCLATTEAAHDIVDLTQQVQDAVADCGIPDGQATVFTLDPGCVVMMNEREAGLLQDIKAAIKRLDTVEPEEGRAMIGSTSVVVPVTDGNLYLGRWQRVLLVELGGACDRDIVVQIVGD